MIWLYNHETEQVIEMTLDEFMTKFNNGEIPDEIYTIQSLQYEHPLAEFSLLNQKESK